MWLVSRRSVSDDARRDCYRWQDNDTSQSLASLTAVDLSCNASTTGGVILPCVIKKALWNEYVL